MARKSGIIASPFTRSLCFALCLALALSGVPLPAHTQSQQPAPGVRTQGPPSPNLPNINAIRARGPQRQGDVSLPAPTRAKRCRHWDKKCQQTKEKKAENRFAPRNDFKGLLAYNRRAHERPFDWRGSNAGLLPGLDFLFSNSSHDASDFVMANETDASEASRQHLPHAFASSLIPMAAVQATNFETARVEPHYRTGRAGEDLFSGNYHWSLPIVSLPGRAGHDLNLTLAYNSLVWTKAGAMIHFDMDYGWPSPGFRFGFPVFYGPYVNSTTNRQAYIVITPSGEAVEMRKVTGYETYEAEDSSYLRLKYDTTQGAWILTAANGTQFIYGATLDIKDRNGNRITATYDANGLMDTITDTLGRRILLEYGEYFELLKVRQVWNGIEKVLAQFDYADEQLFFNFGSLYVDNVTYGQTIPVVSQVTLLDNTRYVFEYNTYGQINKVRRKGGLTFERAWTSYNLPNHTAGQQSDCPLFTTRTDWAYDWSASGGVATQFVFNQPATNPDAATETTAPTLTCGQVTVPDGTIYKQYYYPSPASAYKWRYGLLKMTETVAGGVLKKRTKTNWEQPCGGGSIGNWTYQCNPRVAESNIYDNTDSDPNTWENRRRVTVGYAAGNPTDFNLVSDVTEYDANATTVLRTTHTDYNQTSTYTSRRVIGLPIAAFLYDGGNALQSKVEYVYDESGYLQATSATPTQHDTSNYGVTFLAGRGNQTAVRRYDVSNQSYVEWKTGYNTTGSPIFSRDPRYGTTGAQTTISYDDKWVNVWGNDTANRNTFAYPTTVTDPDNYSSTIKYDFDLGTVRFTTNPKGAVTMSEYDGYGRRWKTTSGYGSASPFYTALSFDSSQNYVQSWSSIELGQPDFYSITTFDGHGRVRGAVSDHPGSTGQYKGVYRGYDTMGRQSQVSNPTEINSSWIPAGDDVAGWAWSFQTYDWQGRPLITTNQDATTRSISYTGCGCAGGQVVTIQDEGDGALVGGQPRRRPHKISYDVLGRVQKVQVMDWSSNTDPATNVYSTTVNAYNVRDQVTSVKEYSGSATGTEACPSATCQKTDLSYDGHGRLQTRKLPIESSPTTYSYFTDDTAQTMTDARDASATYAYNNRKLVTGITYGIPSGVAATPNVTFGYDEVGNRTLMDDGPGRVDYTYDTLNRLETEARKFDDFRSNTYKLVYNYNLAGELKDLTFKKNEIFDSSVSNSYDKAGQLLSVSGSGFGSVTQFTSSPSPIKYRAWGDVKQVTYGNGRSINLSYDSRLRISGIEMPSVMTASYSYYPDSRIKNIIDDFPPDAFGISHDLPRLYSYDQSGRLSSLAAGTGALPGNSPNPFNGDYLEFLGYNSFNNRVSSSKQRSLSSLSYVTTYVNDRNQDAQVTYDQAGNITKSGIREYQFNAVGRPVSESDINASLTYDGNNQLAKLQQSNAQASITRYFIRSSALGGRVIAELDQTGGKIYNYIYAKGEMIAEYNPTGQALPDHPFGPKDISGTQVRVLWKHNEPLNVADWSTRVDGTFAGQLNRDALGNLFDPIADNLNEAFQQADSLNFFSPYLGSGMDLRGGCFIDGIFGSCGTAAFLLNTGAGVLDPRTDRQTLLSGIPGSYEFILDPYDSSDDYFIPATNTTVGVSKYKARFIQGAGGQQGGGQVTSSRMKSCLEALEQANGDVNGLMRARSGLTLEVVIKAADEQGIDPSLLLAIGIRETNFRNIAQFGGGLGRGVFQIDLGAHPNVSEKQAYDFSGLLIMQQNI